MKGCRRHGTGWQAEVRVTGHPRSVRQFPLTTDPKEIQQWRKEEKDRLRRKKPPAVAGSLAKDAKVYLDARKAMPGIKARTKDIELWVKEFGHLPRTSIKPYMIQAVRDRWLTEGPKRVWRRWKDDQIDRYGGRWIDVPLPLSASRVNKRLRALENLFTVLDGRHAYNPVREVPEAQEPDEQPRGLPYEVIEAVIAAMPDRGRPAKGKPRDSISLTKRRLRVIAYTGLSHGELMGVRLADLHLNDPAPWVWIAGRQKGKGTKGTAQPLTEQGAQAFRELVAAKGLGPFSPSAMRKSFLRACRQLGLSGIRPYDLRHSFASEVLEKTEGNLDVTRLLMRHKDARTTLRYAKKAIDPVRAAALEKIKKSGGFKGDK